RSRHWDAARAVAIGQKLDEHSLWTEGDPGFTTFKRQDVSLLAGSPARGRGGNLAQLAGQVLPGCEAGYFRGAAPDAGALQWGEPMPHLPRDPKSVKSPPAG